MNNNNNNESGLLLIGADMREGCDADREVNTSGGQNK
jgi:hypothetical protein